MAKSSGGRAAPSFLERVLRFWRRENLHRIVGALLLLSLLSAVALWNLEQDKQPRPFDDWLWWSIVTLTTVGYGDITPTTVGGRLIGIVLMFFGIGLLSMVTATIASFFVERNLKRERGMGTYKLNDHIIICHWNGGAPEIVNELRSNPRTASVRIAVIAELDGKPMEDDRLDFIRGSVTEASLGQAQVEKARTVVILADGRLAEEARDAQTVLATLTVESVNPAVYTIVELIAEENVHYCERAHADEIIVGREFSSRLIGSAAVDHGLSKVLSELLSSKYGQDLEKVAVPPALVGSEFLAVVTEMKRTNNAMVVAVQRGGEVQTNPPSEYRLEADDQLIAILDRRAAG